MPQLDSDTFTYSDGDLATVSSGKWSAGATTQDCQVASNIVHASDAGERTSFITTWSGSNADHYGQVVVGGISAADNNGPTIRMSNSVETYYLLAVTNAANTSVYSCVTGSFSSLNSVAITWANGDTAYIEMQSTTIITKQNGTTRHNFTDGTIATGRPGLRTGGATVTLDTWAAGDFSAGGPVSILTDLRIRRQGREIMAQKRRRPV